MPIKHEEKIENKEEKLEQTEKALPPEALRALAEAEERRKILEAQKHEKEHGGRGGHDPARYGDWEVKGRAIDF